MRWLIEAAQGKLNRTSFSSWLCGGLAHRSFWIRCFSMSTAFPEGRDFVHYATAASSYNIRGAMCGLHERVLHAALAEGSSFLLAVAYNVHMLSYLQRVAAGTMMCRRAPGSEEVPAHVPEVIAGAR